MAIDRTAAAGVVFVEDPGAVNCIAPVVDLLRKRSSVTLLAAGHAIQVLTNRGVEFQRTDSLAAALDSMRATKPAWLLVGTSENLDSIAFGLTAEARRWCVPSAAVVDSAANFASRFRGRSDNPLQHAPDWLLVPDDWTAHSFRSVGFPADQVRVVGHPHYDHVAREAARLEEEGFSNVRARTLPAEAAGRKVVVFASEISTGLDAEQFRKSADYTLEGFGSSALRTEIVLEELLAGLDGITDVGKPRPFLVLRRHPKELPSDLQAYLRCFDMVSVGPGVLDLLYAADVVVGMTSMLLLEAYLLGVPVVSILPRECERTWLPILRGGEAVVATRREAVAPALERALSATRSTRPAVADDSAGRIVQLLHTISIDRS